MEALVLALAIVAGILAAVELIRSRAAALLAWAVLALALAVVVPALAAV